MDKIKILLKLNTSIKEKKLFMNSKIPEKI